MLAVTIADRKEMAVSQAQEMRARDIGVLINFVRVVDGEARLSGEGELSDHISYLRLVLVNYLVVGFIFCMI